MTVKAPAKKSKQEIADDKRMMTAICPSRDDNKLKRFAVLKTNKKYLINV
jgi:hypothetical protein